MTSPDPDGERARELDRLILHSWSKHGTTNPFAVARGEGVRLWDHDGREYLDFSSQLVNTNIGHAHPRVVEAIQRQAAELATVAPATTNLRRGEAAERILSTIDDMAAVFFTNGGADAVENAIRMARIHTGRAKVLSHYRSYHGNTGAAVNATGDHRRVGNEFSTGHVHCFGPFLYRSEFWAESEEQECERALQHARRVIEAEGPSTFAAILVESVPGTAGILVPPAGYLQGLRELADRHGIVLILDEVMAGFGRTGKLFAFEHGDIVPDIVCMAKGMTSSYAPLGAMGLRDHVAEHFQDNVFWGGLTYNSHSLGLATAIAAIRVLLDEGMIENAANLESVMKSEIARLTDKHPSCKGGRAIGLFGMIDVQKDSAGTPMAPFNGSSPAMTELSQYFWDAGLFTFVRWGSFMCNPPLCITEEQLLEGFAIIDKGLDITDRHFEG